MTNPLLEALARRDYSAVQDLLGSLPKPGDPVEAAERIALLEQAIRTLKTQRAHDQIALQSCLPSLRPERSRTATAPSWTLHG